MSFTEHQSKKFDFGASCSGWPWLVGEGGPTPGLKPVKYGSKLSSSMWVGVGVFEGVLKGSAVGVYMLPGPPSKP